jgi:hypothetical protein
MSVSALAGVRKVHGASLQLSQSYRASVQRRTRGAGPHCRRAHAKYAVIGGHVHEPLVEVIPCTVKQQAHLKLWMLAFHTFAALHRGASRQIASHASKAISSYRMSYLDGLNCGRKNMKIAELRGWHTPAQQASLAYAEVQLGTPARNSLMQLLMMRYSRLPSSLLGSMSRPNPDP